MVPDILGRQRTSDMVPEPKWLTKMIKIYIYRFSANCSELKIDNFYFSPEFL